MPEDDKPGVTGPEYPPPQPPAPAPAPLMFAAAALIFEIATFLALLVEKDDLAFWLALGGLVGAGLLLMVLLRAADDVAPVVGPIPGPPPRRLAIIVFILALATFLALLADRANLAMGLSIAAAVAAGVTVVLLLKRRNAPAARPVTRQ